MLTADTITDEQMLDMFDRREISSSAFTLGACRPGSARYRHETKEQYNERIEAGRLVRARCAEILNARAKEQP